MKKLFAKDLKNRLSVKDAELNHFIFKQISNNLNFSKIIRLNATNKLINLANENSKTRLSNRCIKTVNKKTFHKFSKFSRTVFLKLIKTGQISGIRKSSW